MQQQFLLNAYQMRCRAYSPGQPILSTVQARSPAMRVPCQAMGAEVSIRESLTFLSFAESQSMVMRVDARGEA